LNDEAVQSIKKCAIKCKKYKDEKQMHSEDAPSPEFLELEKERGKNQNYMQCGHFQQLGKEGCKLINTSM